MKNAFMMSDTTPANIMPIIHLSTTICFSSRLISFFVARVVSNTSDNIFRIWILDIHREIKYFARVRIADWKSGTADTWCRMQDKRMRNGRWKTDGRIVRIWSLLLVEKSLTILMKVMPYFAKWGILLDIERLRSAIEQGDFEWRKHIPCRV